MLPLYKALGGLLLGLVAFIVPPPLDSSDLFVAPARLAVFVGIATGLAVFFVKGSEWVSRLIDRKRRPLWLGLLLIAASAAVYFALRQGVDTPGPFIVAIEVASYALLTLLLSALLAMLGALAVSSRKT